MLLGVSFVPVAVISKSAYDKMSLRTRRGNEQAIPPGGSALDRKRLLSILVTEGPPPAPLRTPYPSDLCPSSLTCYRDNQKPGEDVLEAFGYQ